MIFLALFLLCMAAGVFIYIRHKQAGRELQRRERLEEKQERLMEVLRKRKTK